MSMRISIQIAFATASFAAIYFVGLVFGIEFWQAGIYFEELFGGKPLPKITEVFVSNFWLANFLLSLPWFVLLGLPLAFPAEGTGFRSPASFVIRYLAFLSIELFLVFMLVIALLIPFLTYYGVMRSPDETSADVIPEIVLGLAAVVILCAVLRSWRGQSRSGSDHGNGP